MIVSFIVPLYKGKIFTYKIIEQVTNNCLYVRKKNMDIDVELILINDYPNEEIDFISSRDIDICLLENNENEGVHFSRVRGLKKATGEYVIFLDQDDKISNYYLYNQLKFIEDNDAIICNGYYRNGKMIFAKKQNTEDDWLFNNYKKIKSPGQVMLKKNSIPSEWCENIIKCSGADDLFLWSLMAFYKKRIAYNDEKIYIHEENGNNTSFNWKLQIESLKEVKYYIKRIYPKELYKIWVEGIDISINKFSQYAELDSKWDKFLDKYRVKKYFDNYMVVAIYGYGVIGKYLKNLLNNCNIKIKYIVDKEANHESQTISVLTNLPNNVEVDLVIVTPMFDYEDIENRIMGEGNIGRIISIKQLLDEL